MCTDGFMTDMDADGYDPSVSREPCKACNPQAFERWRKENEDE
jgi:hypothetical protein